jgi:O-antigen ligase
MIRTGRRFPDPPAVDDGQSARASTRVGHDSARQKLGFAGLLLIALWVAVIYEPQWLLASVGGRVLLRSPTVLFAILIIILGIQAPTNSTWSKRWQWHPWLLLFIAPAVLTLPFAYNNGFARQSITLFLLFWTLTVGTIVVVDTARRAEALLLMYGLAFLWYALWGVGSGLVYWHYALGNYDNFGAFMVIGVGVCVFLCVAAPKGSRFRRAMALSTALCIVGVVLSFARGAFLATVGVAGLVWWRSPHKGKALLWGVAGAAFLALVASVAHPGKFWAEMQSVFTEGTTSGTGLDRWILWDAGWQVFKENPLFGVGPRNFGPFASEFFEPGDLMEGGYGYSKNPRILYNRSLHNNQIQILAEQGIVGALAYIGILIQFWRQNARLRTEAAQQRWRDIGGQLRLRSIALGLEAGIVGYFITSNFYPSLTLHYFYTLVALNLLLHTLVIRDHAAPIAWQRRKRVGPAGAAGLKTASPGPRLAGGQPPD